MNIEFISYTGSYPNLCCGVLTLRIDGKDVQFGQSWNNEKKCYTTENYACFWETGGCIYNTSEWDYVACKGEWKYNGHLPEEYAPYVDQIMKVFNRNVRHGCCGGCI